MAPLLRNRSLRVPAITLLTMAFALAAPSAVRATDPIPAPYSVSPNPAPAEKAFALYLYGATSDCNTSFTRESVTVSEKEMRINLSYVARTYVVDPPIKIGEPEKAPIDICPVYDQPMGVDTIKMIPPYYGNVPTYKMPALKAGVYEVWVTRMHECLYSMPACKIAVQTESAGMLTVKADGAIAYAISPSTVPSGKDFELNLLSYQFNCGTTYDNLAVNVVEGVITLSYLDHDAKPGIMCPAIYKPYGPVFKISALKAGTYKVKAYRHPACLPCKMLGETADAGVLTVTGEVTRKSWFLKNPNVMAGKGFDLQLLNNAYGNCQTSFSHQSLSSQASGLYASFLVGSDPDRVCITNIQPWGPTFTMQALKVGVYPVYVTELYECEVTAPFCAIKRAAPVPSDTLVVTQTLSLLLSDFRAAASRVDLNGTKASFILPEGIGGTWKAELMSVDGRRLSSASVSAEGGSRAEFEMGMRPDRGVYLIRLSSPDGESHMLPVVRKD